VEKKKLKWAGNVEKVKTSINSGSEIESRRGEKVRKSG
jgi:hypothetical protein